LVIRARTTYHTVTLEAKGGYQLTNTPSVTFACHAEKQDRQDRFFIWYDHELVRNSRTVSVSWITIIKLESNDWGNK
jgi:hypothetical protein